MGENSDFVIQRYRDAAALGYVGDTIVNSLGDIAMCGFGFVLARYLGWSVAGDVRHGRGNAALLD